MRIVCPFSRPSPIACSVWEHHILHISYISRGENYFTQVGEWYAIVLNVWEKETEKKVIVLRHAHRADLTAATVRVGGVDERQWMCYTCGEEVPKSVLFELMFKGIGSGKHG